ncbi:uncharacterized protein DEA37_0006601 [Paragonimus westermani]|uniref:Uncharacterized protein n=1 Tax=Paragonimus westermani TaxID=34504 RepID=A0A5J4NRN3_9TREM|nr:uncharacterized protein DEA37_0006601 [Paragonimus westermani]
MYFFGISISFIEFFVSVSSRVKQFAKATQDLNASLTIGSDISTPIQRYHSPTEISEEFINVGRREFLDFNEEVQYDRNLHLTDQANRQVNCGVTNNDVRHVVTGCHRDQISVVVEDGDEDWFIESKAQSPVENLDPLLVCNYVISGDCLSEDYLLDDLSEQADVHLSSFHPKEFHDQNVSDTETIDEAQIVREIEIVRPMAEQWGETNYATVLRQYPSRRLLKSKHWSGVNSVADNRLSTEDVCGKSADHKYEVDGPVVHCIVQAVPYRNVDSSVSTYFVLL